MIDVRELRFGNYYFYITGEIIKVDKKHFNYIDKFCKFANPIELTPEILEKWCGFIYNDNILELNDFEIGYENDDFVYNQFSVRYKKLIILKVKYLHQLQNLIYVLTGEELKVNL